VDVFERVPESISVGVGYFSDRMTLTVADFLLREGTLQMERSVLSFLNNLSFHYSSYLLVRLRFLLLQEVFQHQLYNDEQ